MDWNDFAGKALAVLGVATVVIPLVRPFVVRFKAWTKKTVNTFDDGVAWWALTAIDGLAALVSLALDVFPVITTRRMSRPPSDDHGSGIGGVPMLCLCLALGSLTTGCAGTTPEVRDARIARWDVGFEIVEHTVFGINQALVPFYADAEEQCHAGDGYEDCIRRWDIAIDTMSELHSSARLGQDALALAKGPERRACIVSLVASLIREAIAAVQALELEQMPEEVAKGLTVLGGLATLFDEDCEVDP